MKKSAIASATPILKFIKSTPQPPVLMPFMAQELWKQVTASYPMDYFKAAHLPLLEAYCRAITTMHEANSKLDEFGTFSEGMSVNPALAIRDKQASLACTLATKLRIAHSSSIRADSKDVRPSNGGKRPWETDEDYEKRLATNQ